MVSEAVGKKMRFIKEICNQRLSCSRILLLRVHDITIEVNKEFHYPPYPKISNKTGILHGILI